MIEKGRHIGLDRDQRYCFNCDNVVENEYHFLLICPFYNDIRSTYINRKYYSPPSLHKFHMLMSTKNENLIKNLAMYVYYAMKLRKLYTGI